MKKIPLKCDLCHQTLEEFSSKNENHVKYHNDIYDCLKALIYRVENLEYELMAKKLPDALCRSSEPCAPSSSQFPAQAVVIPDYKNPQIR
jgi:hypothetical protein